TPTRWPELPPSALVRRFTRSVSGNRSPAALCVGLPVLLRLPRPRTRTTLPPNHKRASGREGARPLAVERTRSLRRGDPSILGPAVLDRGRAVLRRGRAARGLATGVRGAAGRA